MKHPVVWFEVMGDDGDRLRSFYGRLFEWKIDASNPMKYGMVEAASGRGIPGGVGDLGGKAQPKVTFYVATESVDRSLDKAKELGGRILMGRTEVPGGGPVLGMFADPEGNAIGLVEEKDA
jgi:predicted enzyme related to lactoylglutathione lyase